MPQIPEIGIGAIGVPSVGVPSIGARQIIPPPTLPPEPPITLMLGFPVADMPGGEIPHYEPLDFTAGEHTHRTTKAPNSGDEKKPAESKQPVPAPSPAAFNPADLPKIGAELPCPAPDAIPLGAMNKAQTAVIIGYEMVDGRCEPQLKPLDVSTVIGNYLPSPALVMSTAAVAATAATTAIVARPLGDFVLRIIKPPVKRTIKKVNQRLGRTSKAESVWQRQKYQRSLRE